MKTSGKSRRKLLLAGLGSLGGQLALGEALAQDAAKVMPRAYRVALENDKVRVLEFTGRPGMGICGEGMHSHPAHLTIVLSDWTGKASVPGGEPRTVRARRVTCSGAKRKHTRWKTPGKRRLVC